MTQNIFARNKGWTAFGVLVVVGAVVGTVLGIVLTGSSDEGTSDRKFSIDYEKNTFLMDGKPFKYVAGSFHYFRALPETWREKMKMMKGAGLNAVDIYIQWSLHNPKDGVYNWDGIADVERIIEIATEEKLFIILRPGPYICAEIDNGGLPFWLARKYPGIRVRTSDENYMREVSKWYSKLMPRFEKHFYGNGGNIIMVQVENEYGAFESCDVKYKNFLRDETKKYTNENAILFTTDRPMGTELECGQIDEVFVTTDFGLFSKEEVESHFKRLREVQPKGPLVNTEFYTGWLTHWQEPNARRNGTKLAETLQFMFDMDANVDFYMFFGGTNFGFWAGANDWGIGKYMADITSYDYDAPMDETGNPTEKYQIFRKAILKFLELDEKDVEVPEVKKFAEFGLVQMESVGTILSEKGREVLGTRKIHTDNLLTFEELDQFSGFVLYETTLPKFTRDPSNLIVTDLRDRALVYIDDEFVGVLSRENDINTLPISAGYGSKLSILVENQGRINFQIADDYKGIRDRVRVQTFHDSVNTYHTFNDWEITGFPFEFFEDVEQFVRLSDGNYELSNDEGPVVFHGELAIDNSTFIGDTWIDMSGWGKGFVYINGFNIGRYWPLVGPQITIYCPKELLKVGKNQIHMVELQRAPEIYSNRKLKFVNSPYFNREESN